MNDAQLIAALAALGHKVRLDMWRMLVPYGGRGLPAGVLATLLSIPPSSLSFHLRQMAQAGVLVQRRSSRQIIYAVNAEVAQSLLTLFATLNPPPSEALLEAGDIAGNG